jgi:small subunit ribosomal protein S5
VRAVVESAGIRDILTKSLGSTNPVNVVMATMRALDQVRSPQQVSERRGVDVPGARKREPDAVGV